MNDNNNQGTPPAAPINQGPFFSSQQWYPNESAIIQQLAAKAGPYVFTADGTPMGTIHSPEINLTDPNNIIGEVKKRDDDSDKNSLDDDGSSAPLSHENGTMDDGAPRRGKKRAAESSGNWDDTTKVRRQSHNVAEKRRRDKINDKIKELKQLLPKNDTDMSKALNKTYTVEQAIDYIRKLDAQNNSLWEQQQILQEENRYLKLLRATYNLDDGLDKSKELEAQLLGNGVPLKTSFSAMQVPIAVQVNNTGSPTNSRPGSSVLVWTTPFNNNFATQVNAAAPMGKANAVPASPGAIFTADGTAFPFNAANANLLRQSNPMLQMAMVNSGAPGSPKSNSNVNILFDSPPKSNNSTE